jgi:hypothetical protein
MVLLVDHNRTGLVLIDANTRARLRLAKFPADKVAFDENLFFKIRKFGYVKKSAVLHLRKFSDLIGTPCHDVTTL